MLYTGNVNRIIFWVLIPIILLFYIAFRVLEWHLWDNEGLKLVAEQHAINLGKRDDIDCLILGGSNAIFSLSAEQISKESDLTCYNLSLAKEGFSDGAYFDFILNLSFEKKEIKKIIYSPIFPLSRELFAERLEYNQLKINISGDMGFKFVGRSLAAYAREAMQGKPLFQSRRFPLPVSSGDFNFIEYDNCKPEKIDDQWYPVTINQDFKQWLQNNLMTIKNLFPNANISFVLPSTLRSKISGGRFSTFSNSLQSEVVKQSVNYIEQSPFTDISILCDGTHHANSIGRKIRTSELLFLLQRKTK